MAPLRVCSVPLLNELLISGYIPKHTRSSFYCMPTRFNKSLPCSALVCSSYTQGLVQAGCKLCYDFQFPTGTENSKQQCRTVALPYTSYYCSHHVSLVIHIILSRPIILFRIECGCPCKTAASTVRIHSVLCMVYHTIPTVLDLSGVGGLYSLWCL